MFLYTYVDFIVFFVILIIVGLIVFKTRHNLLDCCINCFWHRNIVHIDTGTETSNHTTSEISMSDIYSSETRIAQINNTV